MNTSIFYYQVSLFLSTKCKDCIIMMFNATFNNNSVISWLSVLLMEETKVLGQNHRPVASH